MDNVIYLKRDNVNYYISNLDFNLARLANLSKLCDTVNLSQKELDIIFTEINNVIDEIVDNIVNINESF